MTLVFPYNVLCYIISSMQTIASKYIYFLNANDILKACLLKQNYQAWLKSSTLIFLVFILNTGTLQGSG